MVETTAHWSMLWSPDSCHNSGRYNDNDDANGRTLERTKNGLNIQALSFSQYASQPSQLERRKHLVIYKKWPGWIRSHRSQIKLVIRAGLQLETGETKCKSLDHAFHVLELFSFIYDQRTVVTGWRLQVRLHRTTKFKSPGFDLQTTRINGAFTHDD